ncbi:MAG TPA: cupin domain-containing protein [Gaiellaceae bacterium]|nr:cupin domain-containing protein [Gaiellaceae bacterium]
MDSYTLREIDDLPAIAHGMLKLAGEPLGIRTFGLQVLELQPGSDDYPEHDHADDGQEEVYVVLAGSTAFEVAGERVEARPGSIVRVGAEARRKLLPGPDGARVLAIGCAPGGYERPEAFRVGAGA